ncbi:MAG: hydroxymethylglutaryl-CoA lyase [Cyclobacteriaceae bacterium]|nr:hydroxymethylglutaryl-CoA lyase [Cyclobacteriaceae bacterium]
MQIIECPRDAMQGIHEFIPTQTKIEYLNKLLKVGFHTLDFGSFVSPKAIPQLKDTSEVLRGLDLGDSRSKLLAIIANYRGATNAVAYDEISVLGYPLSISETFQQRNTNKSISAALEDVSRIAALCNKNNKEFVVYISMAFGNPYNDPYSIDYLEQFTDVLTTLGVDVISLSDTIGIARPEQIKSIFSLFSNAYPEINFGVHLHSTKETASEKVKAALKAGCERFDGAILGYGGCPMAKDELVGNIDTRVIIEEANSSCGAKPTLNMDAFIEAESFASHDVFGKYH